MNQAAEKENSTKDEILQTALSLFAERGYDAVGTQEIVDKSKITKPTLYYYFKNKSGLLEKIIEKYEGDFISQVKKAADSKKEFFDSLSDILKVHIEFAEKNTSYFRLRINLLNAPEQSESFKAIFPYSEKLSSIIKAYFISNTKIFGNMKDKEELYSKLFMNNACSISMQISSGAIKNSPENIYSIIHSFIYGFAD